MKLIAFMSEPERQAKLPEFISYGVTNKAAMRSIPPERAGQPAERAAEPGGRRAARRPLLDRQHRRAEQALHRLGGAVGRHAAREPQPVAAASAPALKARLRRARAGPHAPGARPGRAAGAVPAPDLLRPDRRRCCSARVARPDPVRRPARQRRGAAGPGTASAPPPDGVPRRWFARLPRGASAERRLAAAAQRLNHEISGFRSLLLVAPARTLAAAAVRAGRARRGAALSPSIPRWEDPAHWAALRRAASPSPTSTCSPRSISAATSTAGSPPCRRRRRSSRHPRPHAEDRRRRHR